MRDSAYKGQFYSASLYILEQSRKKSERIGDTIIDTSIVCKAPGFSYDKIPKQRWEKQTVISFK